MATVSGGGANFSNGSQGTRGLSAGDWIRLQRLRGARSYLSSNADITSPAVGQTPYSKAMLIPPVVGTSKIRRPASFWTDYRASQTADYVLQRQTSVDGTSQTLTASKMCTCDTTSLTPRLTGCKVCAVTPVHKRIQ